MLKPPKNAEKTKFSRVYDQFYQKMHETSNSLDFFVTLAYVLEDVHGHCLSIG